MSSPIDRHGGSHVVVADLHEFDAQMIAQRIAAAAIDLFESDRVCPYHDASSVILWPPQKCEFGAAAV